MIVLMATEHCTHLGQRGSSSCVWVELSKELLQWTVELALHGSLGVLKQLRLRLILQLLQRPAGRSWCQASHTLTVIDNNGRDRQFMPPLGQPPLFAPGEVTNSANCITHHAVHKAWED